MLDQIEQSLVGPLHVLEHEHERLCLRELLRPLERRPRDLLARALVCFGESEDAERDGEQIRDRVALAGDAQLLERLRGRIVVGDPGRRLDHRRDRPVAHAFAVRKRTAGEDRRALDLRRELGDEPRLADARIAEHGHEMGAAVAHRAFVEGAEQLELDLASDEPRLRLAASFDNADRLPGPHLAPAAHLDRPHVLDLDFGEREAASARPDPDRARRSCLLQARGHVDRLARDERRLGRVVDDLAGLDGSARLEPEVVDAVEDRERSLDRAHSVVLVSLRNAEHRHHGIARKLLDGAAEACDAVRRVFEVRADAPPHDLRVRARHEARRVDEIDEEDCRELPFHLTSLRAGASQAETHGPCEQALLPHL